VTDLSRWLIGGLVSFPTPRWLEERLGQMRESSHATRIDAYGAFFCTKPSYLDWAEDDCMIVVKLGFARIGDEFVAASKLLHSGLVSPVEVDHERLRGNALVLCCDKRRPQFCAYKTLLSVQQFFYTERDDALIFANNLDAIAGIARDKQIDPRAIPLHFIFRSVPGNLTYFAGISRLRPGEVLYRDGTNTRIVLRNTLRTLLEGAHNTQRAGPETVNEVFSQLRSTMAGYLRATSDPEAHWTMLLSGGIDSSVLQMAINTQLPPEARRTSHAYAPEVDRLAPEISYTKTASALLGTEHTFVSVPTADYPALLMAAIRILGQPPHHESTAYELPLFDYIAKHRPGTEYLFSGQGADALHGLAIAERIARALRYQHWPPALLYLLGPALRPISRSRANDAWRASAILRHLQTRDSPQYPANSQAAYTDWRMACRNFGQAEVREALAYRRQQQVEYLGSSDVIEETQTVDLLSDAYDTAGIDHQLALAFGQQVVFPYLDDISILAAFTVDARDRYFSGGRTKPILKRILETGPASSIVGAPKLGGGFQAELYGWMHHGILRDLVLGMNRPSFMSREDFRRIVAAPGWYTWNLLTFDLFQRTVLTGASR
jgi:asparagine synthetase B (glutamine-hydrolysing)